MPVTNIALSTLSFVNSTRTPLAANETFTGDWEDTMQYAIIYTLWRTDTPGTLFYQYSIDGSDIDRSFGVPTDTSDGNYVSGGPRGRYFRILYVNGSTPQTIFRMQTTYSKAKVDDSHASIELGITGKSTSLCTRSVLYGYSPANTYIPVLVDNSGQLMISGGGGSGGGGSGGGSSEIIRIPTFKTAKLVTSSTTTDQVILSYTPNTNLILSSVGIYVWDTLSAYQTLYGEASIESPAGNKLYTTQLTTIGNGKDQITFPRSVYLPASQEVRVVCSPSGPINEQTWQANLIGAT